MMNFQEAGFFMETAIVLPLPAGNTLLLIMLLFVLLDLLCTVTLHAYRTLLEAGIVIPNAEDKDPDRPEYEKMLDDPGLMGKLRTASRFMIAAAGASAMLWGLRFFSREPRFWELLLCVLGIALLLGLLEALSAAAFCGKPRQAAEKFCGLCSVISRIFTPLNSLTRRLIPEPVAETPAAIEEVESHLRDWVGNIPENTLLEDDERKMIRSIVHFSNTMSREIMIPRIEMDALEKNTPLDEASEVVLKSGHSRLPVYEDEIDHIIGVVYAKDLLKAFVEKQNISLLQLLRKPLFVPESKKAGELLNEMRATGIHMAVVVDEYGGTSGIVSMEDIVEEIVGEIRDEYDAEEEVLIQEVAPGEYSFLGRIDLEDVNEVLGTHLTRDTGDTLAGFLYARIGKIPTVNEKVEEEGWTFEIEKLSGKRIGRVHVYQTPAAGDPESREAQDVE